MPGVCGSKLRIGEYRGSHNSLIKENNGCWLCTKNQLAIAPIIINQKYKFKIVFRNKPNANIIT
ncbi:MAG: hypothetical protein VYE31_01155 [Pseudomonadota bacterium]|nr:hypothetical protein [Pseudomonadota bacterium]